MSKILTFWRFERKRFDRPTKQYVLIFMTWQDYKILSMSKSEFDDLKSCNEECKEINDLYYNHHNLPIRISFGKYDYSDDRSWWGYVVLDMVNNKCIKVGGYGFKSFQSYNIKSCNDINKSTRLMDFFFRDPNECPDEYDFNGIEEYNGWLQFKFGDHKNAIDYVAPPKKPKRKQPQYNPYLDPNGDYDEDEIEHIADDIEDKYAKIDTAKKIQKYAW